jgi:hypothetical protein
VNGREVVRDRTLETDEERVTHERMPDQHLRQVRQRSKQREVSEVGA